MPVDGQPPLPGFREPLGQNLQEVIRGAYQGGRRDAVAQVAGYGEGDVEPLDGDHRGLVCRVRSEHELRRRVVGQVHLRVCQEGVEETAGHRSDQAAVAQGVAVGATSLLEGRDLLLQSGQQFVGKRVESAF